MKGSETVKTVYLYSVGVINKRTGDKMNVEVWAENNDEATHKLTDALFGADGSYRWAGTGPVYENNQIVSKNID